jgi:hypothetical protein
MLHRPDWLIQNASIGNSTGAQRINTSIGIAIATVMDGNKGYIDDRG